VRGGQEILHQLAISVRRSVLFKSSNFFGFGWEADEVEIEPARERAPVRFGRRF
jgi:hypothetical protein